MNKKSKILTNLWRVGILITVFNLWLDPAHHVLAQSTGRIQITSPQIDLFPVISFNMEAYDGQGNFITDLHPNEIQVIEDGKELPLGKLDLMQPGLQLIVALNEGAVMENHFNGLSAYEIIQKNLQEWSLEQPFETPDQFSLVTNSGYKSTQLTLPADWASAISTYQPDLMKQPVALNSLIQALDMATDTLPDKKMKRVILYVTQPLSDENLGTFPTLIDRAEQSDVTVFVWMVTTAPGASPKSVEVLNQLAERTDGALFQFSGSETLPNVEAYLQSLRYFYQCSYFSTVAQSGTHNLLVRLNGRGLSAMSDAGQFDINILPPSPVFLAPPVHLSLTWAQTEDGKEQVLIPQTISIGAIVEFPDGFERLLSYSRLYVDGAIAVENKKPPFDLFEWQVGVFAKSGTHMLKVEVVDALGLKGTSIEIPVDIMVEPKPDSGLITKESITVVILVILAAGILFVVIFLAGRRTTMLRNKLQKAREYKDPLTQPVRVRQDGQIGRGYDSPTIPRPTTMMSVPARLVRLSDAGYPIPDQSIPLSRTEITLGSDPQQAITVIESSSVSGLHARMYRTIEGTYMIADAGSVSGTWVNYAPVSNQGMRLENGDLIHIGQIAFRFELRRSAPQPQSHVSP